MTLTFFRPQRESLTQAGEPGAWIDIRDLVYTVTLSKSSGEFFKFRTCDLSQMSTADANLTPTPGGGNNVFGEVDGFLDSGEEADTDLGFSVNLTKCLGRGGEAVAPGDDVAAWLAGGARGGTAARARRSSSSSRSSSSTAAATR